jgi:hypothetical protein
VYQDPFFFLSVLLPPGIDFEVGVKSFDLDPPSEAVPFQESTLRFKSKLFSEHLSSILSNERSNERSREWRAPESVLDLSFSDVESDMESRSDFLSAERMMAAAEAEWGGDSAPLASRSKAASLREERSDKWPLDVPLTCSSFSGDPEFRLLPPWKRSAPGRL